jgi:hypothetical protein
VFASAVGTELDAHNVRRAFRKVVEKAGLVETEWSLQRPRRSSLGGDCCLGRRDDVADLSRTVHLDQRR